MEKVDIFINNTVYPESKSLFKCNTKSINDIKDSCLFVIDTNALLVPYSVNKDSLANIEKVFVDLVKNNRLYIPAQVAREFVNNRPTKIKETYQKIIQQRKSIPNINSTKWYAIFEPLTIYNEILETEKQISKLIQEYQKKVDILINEIKGWTWNDPVSSLYERIFDENNIIEIITDTDPNCKEKIEQDLRKRYMHQIPPGYKDKSKPDAGIGDLLIWNTILNIGKERNKDIIFISGEEKNDWWYRSEKQTLYPRFELTYEFFKTTNGKSFHILKLSDFLGLFEIEENIIQEVQIEEKEKEILTTEKSNETKPFEP